MRNISCLSATVEPLESRRHFDIDVPLADAAGMQHIVNFTDLDGTTGRIELIRGTGTVTFAGDGLTSRVSGNQLFIDGVVTNIANIAITDSGRKTDLRITSRGGGDDEIDVLGLNSIGVLRDVRADDANFSGAIALPGVRRFQANDLRNGSATFGNGRGGVIRIEADDIEDWAITSDAPLDMDIDRWTVLNSTSSLTTPQIRRLIVDDEFQADVSVTGGLGGPVVRQVRLDNVISGSWTIQGNARDMRFENVAADVDINVFGAVDRFVAQNFAARLQLDSVKDMRVTQNLTGSLMATSESTSARKVRINNLSGSLTFEGRAERVQLDRFGDEANLDIVGRLRRLTVREDAEGEMLFGDRVDRIDIGGNASGNLTTGGNVGDVRINGAFTADQWLINGNLKSLIADSFAQNSIVLVQGNTDRITSRESSSGQFGVAGRLNRFTINGDFVSGRLSLPRDFSTGQRNVERFRVKGTMSQSNLFSDGSIGKVELGSLQDSNIFAGVDFNNMAVQEAELGTLPDPATAGDVFVAPAILQSLKIQSRTMPSMSNSRILAYDVRDVRLGDTVRTFDGGALFGIFANSVKSIRGETEDGVRFRAKNIPANGTWFEQTLDKGDDTRSFIVQITSQNLMPTN
jgi:formylmethanofuran dehydrogenase subunit C